MTRTPLPPFARIALQFPPQNGLRVESGEGAWKRCRKANGDTSCLRKYGTASIVFPDVAEPTRYDWSIAAGLEVAVCFSPPACKEFDNREPDPNPEQTHAEMARLDTLATVLVRAGAIRVVVIHPRAALEVYAPRPIEVAA